jgi:isopentenyl-diphosphate delta-isomerase
MGFTTELVSIGNFIYRVAFPNGLIEHELDHVLIGNYSEDPIPNKEEVEDWRYVSLETLNQDIKMNPNDYTYWFKEIMNRFKEKIS